MYISEYKMENINRVLDVALECCEEYGIENINKAIIAERANISTKTVKRYFDTKTEMIFRISQKVLERWYSDIEKDYKAKIWQGATGIEMLREFLIIHNNHLLKDYKALVFLQEADLHWRFHEKSPDMYWKEFRKTDKLENSLQGLVEIGLKDSSIQRELAVDYSAKMITTLCSGIVEHLASDMHCGAMTYEEAVKMSTKWIKQLTMYLTRNTV